MWVAEVSGVEILSASRWTVAFFNQSDIQHTANYPMRPLSEIAQERRGFCDPQQVGDVTVNYLGLENVRPVTGELVEFEPRLASTVKSRSKIFKPGDVLYGRLRPELNKVFLAEGAVTDGICSGEFIVLVPNTKAIIPRLLRYLLSSGFVTQFASRLKVGASLPRMGTEDLLGISVPVPPMDVQKRLAEQLAAIDLEIEQARRRLEKLPSATAHALMGCLEHGRADIDNGLGTDAEVHAQ